jgi:hypothetical protein
VSAYVLYSLASSSGNGRGSRELKSLSKRMTPRQVEQAQAQLANQKTLQPANETEASSLVPLPDTQ